MAGAVERWEFETLISGPIVIAALAAIRATPGAPREACGVSTISGKPTPAPQPATASWGARLDAACARLNPFLLAIVVFLAVAVWLFDRYPQSTRFVLQHPGLLLPASDIETGARIEPLATNQDD